MKSILYTAAGALLILSSCSTAYKSARTPDDVYYSPRTERTYASSNNNQDQGSTAVAAANEDDGTYVTYEDEEQGDYAKRIDRFRNASSYNGSYYDDGNPNIYVNNYYGGGFGYSPYSYWGGGFGYPYYGYGSGLSISLGLGWGWGGGGWYRPWGYSPWYSPWAYNPWYPHYYGGYGSYWGGGWAGHYYPGGYYSAPSRGYRSRSGFGGNYTNANPRVIGNSNTGGRTGSDYRPRRIFRESSGFNGGNNNSGGRTSQPRRIFRSSPSERPTVRPGSNSNGGNYAPRRVFQSAPRSQPSQIRSAPQRSFSSPSPAPSRSSSGGSSGGGGGRTFRSRN